MFFATPLSRQDTRSAPQQIDRTAYLVDDYWPEFDRYIHTTRTEGRDYLLLPVDGQRMRKDRYAWNTSGFDRVFSHRSILIRRAIQSIWLRIARQGAQYQQLQLSQSHYLAQIYGRSLTADITHVVVTQSLLPHLWQAGYLRGRSFDVLMTALPINRLQQRLDLAAGLHPQSPTLNNFRVLPALAAGEMAALAQARRLITPHADLATLWAEKTELLDWVMPIISLPQSRPAQPAGKPTVVLPSASLGRKGIYELKAALTGVDVKLTIAGAELEQPGFWQGFDVQYLPNYAQALAQATVVVSPAWVEHQPRRILQSIACGVPTIVSTACGLHNLPVAIKIPLGDVNALRAAITSTLAAARKS
jgi:glycosyltransferase involved in cell wall biosynthesis